MRVITQAEHNRITDALYYMRRVLQNQKLTDDGKVAALRTYLIELGDELDKIEDRWKEIDADA